MIKKIIIISFILFSCQQKESKSPDITQVEDQLINEIDSTKIDTIKPVEKKPHPDAPKGIFIDNPAKDIIMAEFKTTLGTMRFELYPNRTPLATENFINLAKKGFYNDNIFFRLVPYFVAQTGDKTNTGYGDAGYQFETERHPDLSHDRKGMLSYANFDTESNSSQFFITLSPQTQLDDRHPIFGMIISGIDVLDQFSELDVDSKNKPVKEIKLLSVKIIGY